ncbi:S-layer homology domain-containing protein [Petroclostridium sp. X23]|uniref:S-layer homology domain-containing protein n=1 Tax=Petroclostridium sp. X23 TaxID=3045146 RepID=UPI0024ACB067|nr:S-layer homology domain-containing protein [Petroclostridium sp. X23]WHH60956.1 S-layer homology domain-containing protein [Petroclostridium sp. X23]
MNKIRFISMLLVFLMFFSSMPIQVLAEEIGEEQQKEQLLKEELRNGADETKYPNGLFEFLATRINTSEDIPSVEFAIVRKGGTAGKASVTFKTIDVTAKYGQDYTISVPNGLFTRTLSENESAKSLIESFEGAENSVSGAVYSGTTGAEQSISVADEVYSENGAAEFTELPALQAAEEGGLRAARDVFTGTTSERRTWREMEQASKDSTSEMQNKMYEEVPGVTYTFNFDDGEYMKTIRFNAIDDAVSEDEEQVVFALLNSEGGALGEAVNGFINIQDDEEKEKVEFEMAEDQISVKRSAGYAEVTVRRTAGLYRYGMIHVGTAALTAQPDEDYKPVSTQLRFVPGQESQKVRIPLMEGKNRDELQFLVKLDPESPNLSSGGRAQTVVTVEASPRYLMQSEDKNVQMLSDTPQLLSSTGRTTEEYQGKTYRVKTLTADDITEGDYDNINGWARIISDGKSDNGISFTEDLSRVEFIRFQWNANVKHTYKSKIPPFSVSRMFVGDREWLFLTKRSEQTPFASRWEHAELTDIDRTQNKIQFKLDYWLVPWLAELNIGEVKLYYKSHTFIIDNLPEDLDANITPKVWTSATMSKDADTVHVGSLAFEDAFEASENTYGIDETISLVPKFTNAGLDTSKVYLWGYKIEQKGGRSYKPSNPFHPDAPDNISYYYIKGDRLDVASLHNGKLEDYTGKCIPLDEVLMEGNKIALLPVFRPRNAFVEINFDPGKGGMADNGFSNGQVIKVGMLDTVKFNAYAKATNAVTGYANGHTNNISFLEVIYVPGIFSKKKFQRSVYQKDAIPTYNMERTLEKESGGLEHKVIMQKENLWKFTPIDDININPALPGELDFKPQKTYSKLTVQYGDSSLKVMMDPQSGERDKGSIAYIPEEGKAMSGDSENPIIVSPIERNRIYTFNGAPAEGYRMTWKDFSGDLDENGKISRQESNNLNEYEFNRDAVVGDFYTYVANYDRPLVYYSFEPKPTGGKAATISGKVALKGGTVLGKSSVKGSTTGGKVLAGVEVNVNGHIVATDENGEFEITDSDFETGKKYSLIINYMGLKYTGQVNSNVDTNITVEEYDTFIPYNFTVSDAKNKEVDLELIDNRDANFKFSFEVKSNKQGIEAQKAIIRIYSKEGVARGTGIEVIPKQGRYTFDFNPAAFGVVAGDSMTLQIVDQNDIQYLEHDVGFYFKKYLDTFSLLSSFKSPLKPAVDMVGRIDAAFDLGLAGKADNYIKKTKTEWIVAFGFEDSWEKSLSDGSDVEEGEDDSGNSAAEKLKDAAKEDASESDMAGTNEKSIKKDDKKKKSASVTSDIKFGISTALYLRMIVDEDPDSDEFGNAYFDEMIMSATISGGYHRRVERMTPIGVTLAVDMTLDGTITGIINIQKYKKNFYFDGEGKIDFSNAGTDSLDRDFTTYGKLIVKPHLGISASASVEGGSATVDGDAYFDLVFTTGGSGRGDVTVTCTTTLEIMYFSYEWPIVEEKYKLFGDGLTSLNTDSLLGDISYLYDSAEKYQVRSREYLDSRGGWQGNKKEMLMSSSGYGLTPSNEQILQNGIYPYPYTLLATIGENQQLLVFLDDDVTHDDRNSTHLFYSIYSGSSWSMPQRVDNDDTPDGLPWISDMGDRVLVAWSSAVTAIDDEDMVMEVLNNRNIKARFFDKDAKAFGEVQEVTHETAQDRYSDSEPCIAYRKDEAGQEDLMIVYKKTEYRATGSNDNQDAVVGDVINPYYSAFAYRFYDFDSNTWDESGDTGNGYYGQGFLSVADYVYADESDILITGDDPWAGCWSRTPYADEVGIGQLPGNDPLIVDSKAIGYKDYAVLPYILDMDENPQTTEDRELFIHLYSFKDKVFYPAIRCTDDAAALYDLEFVKVGDDVFLYYISNGDIISMDIGMLIQEGLLEYEIDGKKVFVLNKLAGVYSEPETVVHHRYDSRTDALGNEIIENDMPIDEFMVKADDQNVYVMWGEGDVTYRDGVEPNSDEAAHPENRYREHHIYAARQTIGEETATQIYEEDGVTPMTYPAVDEDGNTIDYTQVKDMNGESGKVKAGDPIIIRKKPVQWSDPVKLTEGKGANYNDLDFEMLPDGNLRAVFVKGFSEVVDVAGQLKAMENVNKRSLMTADFDVDIKKAEVEMKPVPMPKPYGTVPVEISVRNLGLSALKDAVVEVCQVSGGESMKVIEEALPLRGGEEREISLIWQAPDDPSDTRLQAVVMDGDEELCRAEQDITAKSAVDVPEAYGEFIGRNRLKVTGTAVNNGNIAADDAEILAEVSGNEIGSFELAGLDVDEKKNFEFYADISSDMFEKIVGEDGSAAEILKLTVHSPSGTGTVIDCGRFADKQDMDAINNISSFEIRNEGATVSDGVSLKRGSSMEIEPYLTYVDENLQKPRIVYISSDEEIANVSGSLLTGRKKGTATITAYALPQISEIVLSQNGMRNVDNLETLPEAAIKTRSFVVNVVRESNNEGNYENSGNNTSSAAEPAETPAAGEAVTIATTAAAVTDSSGKAAAAVTAAQISEAVGKALKQSAEQGQTGNAGIEIKVEAPSDAKSVEIGIPAAALKEISESGINGLNISSPVASITFDRKALSGIAAQASQDVKITASKVDMPALTDDVKRIVAGRPVFDFSVAIGGRKISQFDGNVTVSVPYTPGQNEDVNAIVIYYINDNGELEIVTNSTYNPQTGMVTFKTNHFSQYAVGYNKITFHDVPESAWYAEAVSFIAARSITSGTESSNYSPGDKLTRGQFLTMMMRAYGIAPERNPADNFTDAGNTYYTGYLAAAKRLGISNGTGNNMFEPENVITRQEMFTLLYSALKTIGQLPEGSGGQTLKDFEDADQTASWAKDAVALFVEVGIIRGSDGRLDPEVVVDRAQMAQVLYNLLTE